MSRTCLLTLLLAFLSTARLTAQVPVGADPFDPAVFHSLRIAHRGGFAHGPENTLETMLVNAREFGVTAFEVDVMLTADSQLVLFHDPTIERLLQCDQPLRVRDLTLAELQRFPYRDTSLGLAFPPSLRQLMDTLGGLRRITEEEILLELDFKPNGDDTEFAVAKLVVMAREQARRHGDQSYNWFFVSSYYPGVMAELKAREPRIRKAYAVHGSPVTSPFLARLSLLLAPAIVRKHEVDIYETNHCRVTPGLIRRWTRRGVLMNAYTVNSACDKAKAETWGIAYTTNCTEGSCSTDASEQMGKRKGWCRDCKE